RSRSRRSPPRSCTGRSCAATFIDLPRLMSSNLGIHAVRGLWCAMLTPIGRHGSGEYARFARHAQALLAQGVDGLAPFGTTGEGQSFSMAERADGLAVLLAAGIPAE